MESKKSFSLKTINPTSQIINFFPYNKYLFKHFELKCKVISNIFGYHHQKINFGGYDLRTKIFKSKILLFHDI